MRIAVTGATGNLGTSVLGALSADADVQEVVGIARRAPRVDLPKVTWRSLDIGVDSLEGVFDGIDAVIHLAWQIQPSHQPDVLATTNLIGSERVFLAAGAAGVDTLIHGSSIGAYSPRSSIEPAELVSENWPTDGILGSLYSQQKAHVECKLDDIERQFPDMRCVRMRPALIFKRESGSEIRRLFLGRLIPTGLVRNHPFPLIPDPAGFTFQAVHASDVATAIQTALHRNVRGAFNLAANPPLDGHRLADLAHVPRVPIPRPVLRKVVEASWRLHLQPTDPGWIDMALHVPLMSTERAQRELDWTPTVSATDAFAELVEGLSSNSSFPTPPMRRLPSMSMQPQRGLRKARQIASAAARGARRVAPRHAHVGGTPQE